MRARLSIRVCGLLAGTALAASAALGAAAPAARASVSSVAASSASATGPSGVGAWSAAVENAATGRLLWSRGLNTERPMASITKVMTA